VLKTIIARNKLKKLISSYFESMDFVEVDIPLMVPYCNPDSNVENVKVTFKDFQGREFNWFLHTSPELPMKRLLWHGLERIYSICKVFRSSEVTPLHSIEFTMVEWYRVGGNYFKGMEETEELVKAACSEFGVKELSYRGKRATLSKFEKLEVEEAFKEFAGIKDFWDKDEIRNLAGEKDYEVAFHKLLVSKVEPKLTDLGVPVFLYNFPKELSALSKVKGKKAERFELYISGVELANGYTELTRYEDYLEKLSAKKCSLDAGLLKLLKAKELPSCEGVALGFDRLLMLLTGKEEIREVIPFSTLELIEETNS
jgi:lysyl-tRNA synthetase class 2